MAHLRPDYSGLRESTGFSWSVGASYYALLGLVPEISMAEFSRDPTAGIELFRTGRPRFRELFDDRIPLPAVSTPAVSYGHIDGLGVELVFPEDGEVNYVRSDLGLHEWIEVLKRRQDFPSQGRAPFFLDYHRRLKEAFPGEHVGFSYGYEGPMTTAYELRDSAVFTDVYDEPEKFREFMRLLVASIVEFAHFHHDVLGIPRVSPAGSGMCDDVSSMFHPDMWPEMVLPYIHAFYDGLTTGRRTAHIEDLRPEQLHFLEDIGLFYYDPSISPKISPPVITRECRVPFGWRLGSYHYWSMNAQDIRDWIFQATADGASKVFTHVAQIMVTEPTVSKVYAFMDAAAQAERMLREGASREEVGQEVSEAGRKRFWGTWPD